VCSARSFAGAATAWQVYEDGSTVAFLDIGQATVDHTLVVPRRHAPDLWSLSEDRGRPYRSRSGAAEPSSPGQISYQPPSGFRLQSGLAR
jgi:hypothetical protein